jgi:hypothetical protein
VEGGVEQFARFGRSGHDTTVYYDERLAANDYLGGRSYQGNGVSIVPVPEPGACAPLLAAALAVMQRRRQLAGSD